MWIIGLTGAIGAGKSRVAAYFHRLGIPVHCSDTYIHFLFENDPDVQQQVKALWPDVFAHGKIDRLLLGEKVLSSFDDLHRLEGLLYPKLVENQRKFLEKNQYRRERFVVLDVPLLFEVDLDVYCDCVILVSSSSALRKQRVMERKGMTPKKYLTLENLQMKDSERRKKADFILYTGRDKGYALKMVQKIIFSLSQLPFPKWQGKWPKNLTRRPHESRNCFRHRNDRI
ncbi:MAG: dephospho-CoA kinase [Alphaproteobacteria bacterium]|nr:dephospho-CoA kinase [Alphaproteobacteria bacterium]